MKAREVMTAPAITCRLGDNLNTAAQLMWEHDCGAIPVVDDSDALVGILTDRDICMSAYTQGQPLRAIAVQKAMARQVFTCGADDSLHEVERLMSEKQVRRVPVVDVDERVIGLISLNDIARFVAATGPGNGFDHELTHTMAAICEPRSSAQTPEPELAATA